MALDSTTLLRIRVLVPDAEAIHGDTGTEYLFTDEELEAFYDVGYQNVLCAAGLVKQAIGASEALLLKVIKNYETSTNGASLMREWVIAGEKLYDRGLEQIASESEDEGIFEVVYPDWGYARHPEGMSHGSYQIGGWM